MLIHIFSLTKSKALCQFLSLKLSLSARCFVKVELWTNIKSRSNIFGFSCAKVFILAIELTEM